MILVGVSLLKTPNSDALMVTAGSLPLMSSAACECHIVWCAFMSHSIIEVSFKLSRILLDGAQ